MAVALEQASSEEIYLKLHYSHEFEAAWHNIVSQGTMCRKLPRRSLASGSQKVLPNVSIHRL